MGKRFTAYGMYVRPIGFEVHEGCGSRLPPATPHTRRTKELKVKLFLMQTPGTVGMMIREEVVALSGTGTEFCRLPVKGLGPLQSGRTLGLRSGGKKRPFKVLCHFPREQVGFDTARRRRNLKPGCTGGIGILSGFNGLLQH